MFDTLANDLFNLLVILGPTASGKTRLAVQLARQLDGEVISADSRQVYRGLDIGSGKDLAEYKEIPHHLIDIVDPGYEYSVFDFQRDFLTVFEDINQRNKLPIMAGGSALYVDAVLKGYRLIKVEENPALRAQLANCSHEELVDKLLCLKPKQHNTTDLLDRDRLVRAIEIAEGEREGATSLAPFPAISPFIIGLHWERSVVKRRISERLKARLDNEGLIDEVQSLNAQGVSWETLDYYGLEYRFIGQYLQGKLNYNDMQQKLNSAIHQFAKKQDTWLRRLQKNGFKIHWVDGKNDAYSEALQLLR